MVSALAYGLAVYGMYLLWSRIGRHGLESALMPAEVKWPKVTVIVPARNEESNIAKLLTSLVNQSYQNLEIIVVDDGSVDRTSEIVQKFPVKLIRGQEKPNDWNGKQWACWQGAQAASGDWLLFTDADTCHDAHGVATAMKQCLATQADMFTALPYHKGTKLWEKLMGPFHVLLLSVTNPSGKPRVGQVFAIGQYLLFRRNFYNHIDGHRAVKAHVVEDLPLANLALLANAKYVVYQQCPLYEVRMYDTLEQFIRGWRRNFQAGFAYGSARQGLEMSAMFAALYSVFNFSLVGAVIGGISMLLVFKRQKCLGNFASLGAVTFVFPIILLTLITLLAAWDKICRRPVIWKDRFVPRHS